MSAITLPTTPWPNAVSPARLSYGVRTPSSPLGGIRRRYDRVGARHRIDFKMPPMQHGAEADAFIAALLDAEASADPVRMVVPQNDPRDYVGISGALVQGAAQAGRTLNVDTITLASGTIVPRARGLSMIVSSRSYFYYTAREANVSTGAAALVLDVMLRASPADNTAVELNNPVIEGDLEGDVRSWTIENATIGLEFSITERA